ncbi:glycosyltransferase [Polaribacter sargassicola]|uniref:glycosyltransferase n=1 Tax=Polaribacter sargassicola TaxID=2836891 RepID=UPI001F38E0D1|nr:glycosyltransferase [Polaribacter sp. DS7-9]MCG1036614.1 glycosyltransferase [Polaribacter sp. DS7-9]
MFKTEGIIQVIDSLNAGGAEVLAVNIANGLAEEDYNSHICATREEGILNKNIDKKVGFLSLKRKKTIDIEAIFKFINYIKNNNILIVHAHSTSYFFVFCVKLFYPKINLIWHDHYGKSQNLDSRKLFPLNICSYFFKSIISVNNDLKKWAENKLNCSQVYFLHNFAEFTNKSSVTELKGNQGKRIVHLAAFREQKDHINLLKAFKIVIRKYPDYSLHLIGEIHKNDYSEEIKSFIKKNNLTNNVYLYGVCSDIENILKQSDIGVLSSKSEGLPVSLLEYGLAKLPVLVTNVGDCNKVVNHKKAIVIPENSNVFAEYLIKLIDNDHLREDVSAVLYKYVHDFFSKENFIYKLKKIYFNI